MTDPTFKDRLLESMIEQRRGADGDLNWEHAPPYVLRHAVDHAADIGRADELLIDPELLSCADPAGVVPNLDLVVTESARHTTAVYRASLHRHRDADASTRRDLLALDAARLGEHEFGARLTGRSHSGWRPRWGTGSKVSPAQRDALDDLDGPAEVAIVAAYGRRPVALVGGADTVTAVWDLTTGQRIGMNAGAPGDRASAPTVAAAAPLLLDGRPYAAVVDPDGAVWLWNLTDGYPPSEPIAAGLQASSVAVAYLHGRPTLLLALTDGSVAVLDVLSRDEHDIRLETGQDRAARAVLAVPAAQGWIAVAVCGDRSVLWGWDLAGFREVATLLHEPRVATCAAFWHTDDDRDLLLIGDGVELHCWTLGGERLWSFDVPACSVAVTRLAERQQVAVVGGSDGTLQIWDLKWRRPLHRPWPVSREPVAAVAVAECNGRPVSVTADGDDTARLWDLGMITAVNRPAIGHTDDVTALVTAVQAGEAVVLSGGNPGDPVVRGWSLADGAVATPPWEGHRGAIRALALAEIDGVRFVLAGSDGGVQVREVETGRLTETLWERLVRSLAVGRINGSGGAVTTVGVVGDGYGRWSVWDVRSGEYLYEVRTGMDQSIYALAVARGLEGDFVVTGGADGALRRWDLATGAPLSDPVPVHGQWIDSLAVARVGGESFAVSGSRRENLVGVTRLSDGAPLFEQPLRVERDGVLSVATGVIRGEHVVVAGDWAGVHLWRLADGSALPSVAMPAPVNALAIADDGELVVGTGWDVVVMEPAGAVMEAAEGMGAR